MRLKALVSNPTVKVNDPDRPFVALEHLESGTGRLLSGVELEPKDADDSVAHEAGDVRFGKLRPYLTKSYLAEAPGAGSGELLVLRPGPRVLSRYLWYVTLSQPFVDWAVATSYGVKMPRTSWEAVGAFDIDLPTLDEQRRILEFLDNELARVDDLLGEVRQTEMMVEERRWLVVAHAFTGLQPSAALRRGLVFLTDGPFGSAFTSADYSDEGAAVVRLGNIGFAEWRGEELARIPLEMFETFRRYQVRSGDLLVASLGDERNHAGRACVAPAGLGPAMVKGKCFCARVDDRVLDAEYAALFLSSPIGAQALAVEARGSTRQMINLEILKAVQIPMPSVAVQRSVVEAALAEWERSRSLTAELSAQRVLLRERRQALITAAVTGGLEAVRKVA